MTTSANFFTSLDGTDENGTRAEVYVQSFSGTVKDIKENTDKKVADVHFSVGNLKFPIHGWINIEEPVYELAKTAYETSEEVTFRIETQRKPGVERTTPMEELRKDSSTARDNVKVLLVAINGLSTSEAVTNPKEDPKGTNGRYVAGDEDIATPAGSSTGGGASISKEAALAALTTAAASPEARASILDSLAAQVLLHGATVEEVNVALAGQDKRENGTNLESPRASYAQEAPAWKEYNSDGRLNLGATAVAAGVGVETLVTKQIHALSLSRTSNIEEVTEYFTNVVFAIADRVQVAVYGNGARVDRAANSHTRIRGILYEVIEKDSPFPLTLGDNNNIEAHPDALKKWISETGKRTITKFKRAINASQAHPGFGGLVPPASLFGNAPQSAPAAPVSPSQPSSPAAPSSPVTSPVSEMTQEEKMAIARAAAQPQPTQESSVPTSAPVAASVPVSNDSEISLEEREGVMPPRILTEDEKNGDKASPDTVQGLKELMYESGLDPQDKGDLVRISHLLGYTFGKEYTNPNTVPDEVLIEFIDWYAGNGSEALNNALRISREQ